MDEERKVAKIYADSIIERIKLSLKLNPEKQIANNPFPLGSEIVDFQDHRRENLSTQQ